MDAFSISPLWWINLEKGCPAAGKSLKHLWHHGEVPQHQRAVRRDRAEPAHPFRPPVRAWELSEWALLPLRLFLGVTFTFAGLQKLANPNFFDSKSPISRSEEHTS